MNKPILKLMGRGGVSSDHGHRSGILRILGRIGWLVAARLQELETEDSKERSLD